MSVPVADPPALTEKQKAAQRKRARAAIETALRESWDDWRPMRGERPKPVFALAATFAMDALGDLAAEILSDGTMLKSLTMKDGVATLELEPATEILKIFVASMRGVLDGYGAENYLETEMSAPSVSMDLQSGENPLDSYTVTIQRRTRPTPHEFRQRADRDRAKILAIVSAYVTESNDCGGLDCNDLTDRLDEAGFKLPEDEAS